MFRTPKRTKTQVYQNDVLHVTPPNRIFAMKTPDSSPANGSPSSGSSTLSPSETRRGRPRAEILNSLILQGSTSPSSIKCTFCNRVFPREKSLQAHLRTHTGEKPYVCDFPRCTRRFAQSGQLKTHQRLHTGEKPFICSAANCERRFTHANRHCPEHPDIQLKRFNSPSSLSIENIDDEHYKKEIQKWMDTVKIREKTSNPATYSTPKKSKRSYEETWLLPEDEEQNENINTENIMTSKQQSKIRSSQELTYGFAEYFKHETDSSNSSHLKYENILQPSIMNLTDPNELQQILFKNDDKIPFVANEVEVETSPIIKTELPKKRWLREAVLEQQRWDIETTENLALPINWGDDSNIIEHENQKRPTVLMKISNGDKKNISPSDMQIAMALVELGNLAPQKGPNNYNY